ncbi:hypothetical protein [Actinomadura luteofluorescens]|uniref:hypothetical protein n=1 Tax=Actinomadura luteofluorescens TaxID=46163 RepID=UPI003D9144CF
MGEERVLAELLQLAGNTVVPSDGLERIRARIAQPRRPWWRRALAHLTRKNGAPGCNPGTPDHCTTNGWKEPKAMTTIIRRRARDVRAGDIITADPDHNGLPVRWRVSSRPKLTGEGVAIIDYVDISDEPRAGIAHFDGLVELAVEPVGGAA